MSLSLSQSIRTARQAVGLTQEQLARRIGLKMRAISRWEREDSVPSRRNRIMLVEAVRVLNADVAAQLAAGMDRKEPAPLVAQEPLPRAMAMTHAQVLDLALFAMSDDLDVLPRRVRGALLRLCKRLDKAGMSIQDVQREIERTQQGREEEAFSSTPD